MLHFCMCTKMSCSLNRFLSKIINETFYLKVFCLKNNNCYLQVNICFYFEKGDVVTYQYMVKLSYY